MYHQYLLVRVDLPLPTQLVQSCHAGIEAGKHFCRDPALTDSLVVLQVRDENALLACRQYVEDQGIKSVLFREPDLGDTATALCTEPVGEEKRKVFKKFRLWRPIHERAPVEVGF